MQFGRIRGIRYRPFGVANRITESIKHTKRGARRQLNRIPFADLPFDLNIQLFKLDAGFRIKLSRLHYAAITL
ncbi:Uncharacterised protein [Vibrio cholerae]|nr:Uncharacterised protein [Vibrio cholerae]CSC06404.1 Uncharacterised protein [Vibrio cholerae]CSD13313.1 Uncharacterised protein [Vibrio cholerae]